MNIESNKIAGAIFGTMLVMVGLNIASDALFHEKKATVAGYNLPVPEAKASESAPAAQAAPAEALPVLLASADAAKGQNATKKCAACHSFDQGGPNRVGPNLYDVVTGPKGKAQGFGYSAALKERAAKGETWGYEELYAFLQNPKGYLPGTTMAFAGVASAKERADIIAYLRSLSGSPKPLPTP
jgi:cytochrome c